MAVIARALLLWLAALTSAETVNDCIESQCSGCSGEQCQLCREDKNTISTCVSSCMDTICKGCGGEQCQLCQEDAKTVESCCSQEGVATAEIDMCKASTTNPCDGLYGAESLQCAWEEDAKSCVESSCQGCSGEQCQLCRQDAETIASCCDEHYHSVDPPEMCTTSKEEAVTTCMDNKCTGCGGEQCQLCREDAKSECCTGATVTPSCEASSKAALKASTENPCAGLYGAESLQCAWEEDVKTCMASSCQGCGGEQCQLCQEDAERINTCCQNHWHSVDPPQMCTDAAAELETKNPCDGLYGAESLQCAWEEDAKSCVESSCQGCSGEQCQLCRQDAETIASCCDEHYHSVDPPEMCTTSKEEAVTTCMDNKCTGCGGEQCQLCREDAKSECCTGATVTPSCEASSKAALLP